MAVLAEVDHKLSDSDLAVISDRIRDLIEQLGVHIPDLPISKRHHIVELEEWLEDQYGPIE